MSRPAQATKPLLLLLFERHRQTAATLVGRLLDRREDVDDVLQEAPSSLVKAALFRAEATQP